MALTDIKVRQAKATDKPLKITDGNGLYIEVKPNGSKLWRYRYRIAGKENVYAIGEYPAVSLADARRERDGARELVKQGRHPAHARQLSKTNQLGENANTFKAVAEEWISKKKSGWTLYYLKQVERGMKVDVYPLIGHLPIRDINARKMLQVVDAVAERGAETVAINVRQWCGAVFRYGVATLRADHDPCSAIRGSVIRPEVVHAEAMPDGHLQHLMQRLERYGGLRTTYLAIKLMLYTFVRTIEIRRGTWAQLSLDDSLWSIEAGGMKMRRKHMVPLSRQAKAVLEELKELTGGGQFMFPNSRRPKEIMSATTINRAMEYLGVPFTGHDFRATASTNLHEMGWRDEVIELQLAHVERNKTKAAYNHAKYMPERREMMQAWADWVDGLSGNTDSK